MVRALRSSPSSVRWRTSGPATSTLTLQVALEGQVEALDLAAVLPVVGAGVLVLGAQSGQFEFEQDLASAGASGEDGGVVAEQGGRQIELPGGGQRA